MNEWNSRAVSLNITSHPAYTHTGPGTHTRRGPPAHARSLKHQEGRSTHTQSGWVGLGKSQKVKSWGWGRGTLPRGTGNCQWSSPGEEIQGCQGYVPDKMLPTKLLAPSVVSTCLTLSPQITDTPS